MDQHMSDIAKLRRAAERCRGDAGRGDPGQARKFLSLAEEIEAMIAALQRDHNAPRRPIHHA